MNLLHIAAGAYGMIALFLAGVFAGDEMSFANPRYGKAVLSAVLWLPLLVYGRLLYDRFEWLPRPF